MQEVGKENKQTRLATTHQPETEALTQGVSGGIVNILGSGSMDYSE